MSKIPAILPIAGVPDALLRAVNSRLRGIEAGGVAAVAPTKLRLHGGTGSRTVTADDSQTLTDTQILFDTSTPTHAATTDTLAAAVTTTTQTAWTLTGTSAVNGTYLTIGTERVKVISGGGTSSIVVERGDTPATYSNGTSITIPGWIVFTLQEISKVRGIGLIGHKITTDTNYVVVLCGGADTFPGGGTTILLVDTSADQGTFSILAPGAGSTWIQLSGAGASGPPGSGGTPAALHLTFAGGAATVLVPYSAAMIAAGGVPPYTFSVTVGILPPGVYLDSGTGAVTGTPITGGSYAFTAHVVDAAATAVSLACTIVVNGTPDQPSYVTLTDTLARTFQTSDQTTYAVLQIKVFEFLGGFLGTHVTIQFSSDAGSTWGTIAEYDSTGSPTEAIFYRTTTLSYSILQLPTSQYVQARAWSSNAFSNPGPGVSVLSASAIGVSPAPLLVGPIDVPSATLPVLHVTAPYQSVDKSSGLIVAVLHIVIDTPGDADPNAWFYQPTILNTDSSGTAGGSVGGRPNIETPYTPGLPNDGLSHPFDLTIGYQVAGSTFTYAQVVVYAVSRTAVEAHPTAAWQDPTYSVPVQFPGGLTFTRQNYGDIPAGAIPANRLDPTTVAGGLEVTSTNLGVKLSGTTSGITVDGSGHLTVKNGSGIAIDGSGHVTVNQGVGLFIDGSGFLAVNPGTGLSTTGGTVFIPGGAITNALLAALSVATANLQDNSVTAVKIPNASITTAKIQTAAITTALIANAAITNALLGSAVVGTANIQNAAITTGLIANLAVGSAQISDCNISKLLAGTATFSATVTLNSPGNMSIQMSGSQILLASGGSTGNPSVTITSSDMTFNNNQSGSNSAKLKLQASAVTLTAGQSGSGIFSTMSLSSGNFTILNETNPVCAVSFLNAYPNEIGIIYLNNNQTTDQLQISCETSATANPGFLGGVPTIAAGFFRWRVGGVRVKIPFFAD